MAFYFFMVGIILSSVALKKEGDKWPCTVELVIKLAVKTSATFNLINFCHMRNIAAVISLATLLLLQTVLLVVNSLTVLPAAHRGEQCTHHLLSNRRAFIANTLLTTSALLQPTPTLAAEEEQPTNNTGRNGKPYAPLDALLPATRLKLWVGEIYMLSKDLSNQNDRQQQIIILQQMNNQLSNPPKLFQGETMTKRTNTPTAQLTTSISSANKDQYQMNRNGLNVGDKVIAMWNQADVERQWGMLQYAESKREEGNEMRAAFNFYARQLSFADEYVLTAPKDKRKEMIRNDALPSVTAVIASDLDRRDLYRNEFLTAIDDAVAEVAYQVRLKPEEEVVDVTDVVNLVNEAHEA
eukprot:scaffold3427_cov74-Skeletonema_marinoi.AAC.1